MSLTLDTLNTLNTVPHRRNRVLIFLQYFSFFPPVGQAV